MPRTFIKSPTKGPKHTPKTLPMTTVVPRDGQHPPSWLDYCAAAG